MNLGHEQREAEVHWRGRGSARTDTVIDSQLQYRPDDPVRVRVVRREQRTSVTDDGAAIAKAGRPMRWREIAERVERDLIVNVSHQGVVSLPVVAAGPTLVTVVQRIADASLDFYQGLLDVQD